MCETSVICIRTFYIFTDYKIATQHFENKLLSKCCVVCLILTAGVNSVK